MKELLEGVYKRKSMRKFDSDTHLTKDELALVEEKLRNLKPLCPDIAVEYEIVPCSETNCKFNAEYCLLCYSEQRNLWLENIGYMLEQWDLYLATLNIGVCWYGMGRVDEKTRNGLTYAIMLCFGKSKVDDFRRNAGEFDRKNVKEVWTNQPNAQIAKVAELCRLAPSAVNSQPWRVEQTGNTLKVYRKLSNIPLLNRRLFGYFNKIDIGIFITFLDVALESEGLGFTRELHPDNDGKNSVLTATYTLV